MILNEIPEGPYRLIAGLLYGSGLRLMDACRLRMKDISFERKQIVVREGKGEKDRCVPLPQMIIPKLQVQMELAKRQHESDLNSGAGWVWLPYALADKFPNAGRTLAWQYIFPANGISARWAVVVCGALWTRSTCIKRTANGNLEIFDGRKSKRAAFRQLTNGCVQDRMAKQGRLSKSRKSLRMHPNYPQTNRRLSHRGCHCELKSFLSVTS